MKKRFRVWAMAWLVQASMLLTTSVRADMFGGDDVVLAQILANAVQQLQQLQQIMRSGQDSLAMIRDINRGINDSLSLIRTTSPYRDAGIYSDWNGVQTALQGLESIYGAVTPSKVADLQRHTDRNVAEAITLNNAIYDYSKNVDTIGETIKQQSHAVSPGGAQKLTAESLGVLLNVMNQNLRAQATGLKLQAQALAVQNQKDKESVGHLVDSSAKLSAALKTQDTQFQLPSFQ